MMSSFMQPALNKSSIKGFASAAAFDDDTTEQRHPLANEGILD